jgi:hypothetical protein
VKIIIVSNSLTCLSLLSVKLFFFIDFLGGNFCGTHLLLLYMLLVGFRYSLTLDVCIDIIEWIKDVELLEYVFCIFFSLFLSFHFF